MSTSGRATLLATVIAAVVASSAGCGSPVSAGPAASPSPSTASTASTVAITPVPGPQPGLPAHWMGPPDPQAGVSYPFDLLTHCGIDTTRFGGRYWQATTPRPEPGWRPDPDRVVSYDGYTAGTMTLLGENLLRFVITDPQVVSDGGSVDFMPLPAEAQPPPPCA